MRDAVRAIRWVPTILVIPASIWAWSVAGPPSVATALTLLGCCVAPFVLWALENHRGSPDA